MFKSRNLHVYLRNHHNKHANALYILTKCGVQHNNSRRTVDGKILAYLSRNILLSTLDFHQINA